MSSRGVGGDEGAALGLRYYVCDVASRLGVGLDSIFYELSQPANAYLALPQRARWLPTREVALLWDEGVGWALAIETGSGEDLLLVAYLGGEVLPEPDMVATFVHGTLSRGILSGARFGSPDPPNVRVCADLHERLVAYAKERNTGRLESSG